MPAKLELRDLRKHVDQTQIIKGVSLTIEPGEFVVLVGPSGCGKSTLLRMIAGLEPISSGELLFDDTVVNDWDPARRRIGMVFQSYALYPHMSVEENIGFGLKLAGTPAAERKARVADALRTLQLEHLARQKPSQLSGGQRQRVAIGRTIVRNPNAFLFDEPLSNLDAALRVQMRMEIGRLHQRLRNTVVYVTHDQVEAMTLADRIVVLEAGQIRQIGTPMELYERPANRFVAGFIGTPTMGFIAARARGQAVVIETGSGQAESVVDMPGRIPAALAQEALTIGIRPENCRLCDPSAGILRGLVIMLERLGADTFAFLDVPGAESPVAVRLSARDSGLAPGQSVGFDFDQHHALLFDAAGQTLPQ